MENRLTLLAVLAHPDDESFGMGGTLALYANQGAAVHLVCATRGEAGIMDEEHLKGFTESSQVREAELRCAAKKLGLEGVHFLDYRDSGMEGTPENKHPQALFMAPIDDVTSKVVYYIRKLKPQVVVTFDPIGGYRHPDHIAIHQATLRAFIAAGDPSWRPTIPLPEDLPPYKPQKLYYHTISRTFLKMAVRVMPLLGKDPSKWGHNGDIDLTSLSKIEFPTHAVVNFKPVAERKRDASLCHSSQGGSAMVNGLMRWVVGLGGYKETYMRAFPPPENGKVEKDLFAGIN